MSDESKTGFVHMTLPSAFISSPYQTKPNEQGKTYTKAIATFPEGVTVNDIDLGGFKASLFISQRAIQSKLNGKPCTFSMREDLPVSIWKEEGEHRVEYSVDPWNLAKAVKAEREAYQADRAAERDREHGRSGGEPSLNEPRAGGEPDPCIEQEGIAQIGAAAIETSEILAQDTMRAEPMLDL